MQAFEYVSPRTVAEVGDVLASNNGRARVLCGGTDLLVGLRENRVRAELLVDVKNVPELASIRYDSKEGGWIGAAASCFAISHARSVLENYPGLVDAVGLIGGVQIQYRASLGGNLCNASPAADSIPALIVHEAGCIITGNKGDREVPVEGFCTAPGKTVLKPGEFLLAVKIPPPKVKFGAAYLRFTPRNEMDIAVVGAGASVILDETGTHFQSARIALGAVAPTPLFVKEAAGFLAGKGVTPENIQEAAMLARAAARPITDLRGTAEYRKHLSAVLTRRALERAVERARAS
jgi:CO/xanthine dehydrogenase FAD-binding subunit